MEQFEFANKFNVERFQGLLKTSLNDSKERTIQQLLIEEKFEWILSASKTEVGIEQKYLATGSR
jgi:hypothetical protein